MVRRENQMSEYPCQSEHDDYMEAMKEWVAATEEMKKYVTTEPLDPVKDVEPIPFDALHEASKREEEAIQRFYKALEALEDCEKRHRLR
jgi:hypothetical protein